MLYAYNDSSKFGKSFFEATLQLNKKACLFETSMMVPNDSHVFILSNNNPVDKSNMAGMLQEFEQRNCITLPSIVESSYCNNPLEKHAIFKKWMPSTRITKDLDTSCIYRIIIAHNFVYGLMITNRKFITFQENTPKGLFKIAINFCIEIAQKVNTNWMGFNIIFKKKDPYLVDVFNTWSHWMYKNCSVWEVMNGEYLLHYHHGDDMFKMAIEALMDRK